MATPMKTCQNLIAVSIKRQIGFDKVPAVYIGPLRCLSSVQPSDHDHVSPPGRLKKYVVDRFMRYVDHYESKLGRRYPKVYKVYKVFTGGMKDFLSDAHCYYNVSTSLWAGQSLGEFSRKELETYRQAPRDLVKMAPMLLVTALPLVPYVIFPVAYLFPRYFLTSHFWTPEQRTNFALLSHKHRLQHFPPILDYLHNQCRYLDEADRQSLRAQLKKIEKGLTVEEVLDLKRYFETFPYHLQRLSIAHVRHLARSLGMSLRRSRLIDEAALLRHIDAATAREGVEKLTDRELETACFWRGLNPVGMSRVERLAYIRQWLSVSAHTDDETVSLLLHSPVLLAYYQPTNKIFMSKRLSWRAKR